MNEPISIVVIGCGAVIEELYLPSLIKFQKNAWIRVDSLVDKSSERIKKLNKYFPAARSLSSIDEVATSKNGIALVTSPPKLHKDHAVAAFSRGYHVFCEKPISTSYSDCLAMIREAETQDKLLGVGMVRRFLPTMVEAKRILASGKIGRIQSVRAIEGGNYSWPVASAAPFDRSYSGGGVLIDKGVHIIDQIVDLFGSINLLEYRDDAERNGVESNSHLRFTSNYFDNGSLKLSWEFNMNSRIHVQGEQGEFWFLPSEPLFLNVRYGRNPWVRQPAHCQWPISIEQDSSKLRRPASYYDCIQMQFINFLRVVLGNSCLKMNPDSFAHVIEIIEKCYSSAKPLEKPWLDSSRNVWSSNVHWRTEK